MTILRTSYLLKALTYAGGLALLVYGALYLDYPDWDIGISVVMSLTTLASAEWVTMVIWTRQWRWMPFAVFWTWLAVDGVYWAYWSIVKPEAMLREGQWLASLCLYLLCGIIWYRLVPIAAEIIDKKRESKHEGRSSGP
jgi:hypothetical protein